MNYNYLEAIVEDIKEWMRDNDFDLNDYEDLDDAREYLYDALWDEDSITGNGPMGYAKRKDYEDYLSHNWDELINAIDNFYVVMDDVINILEKRDVGYILQWCDSLIRLNLLSEAISAVLDDMNNTKGF